MPSIREVPVRTEGLRVAERPGAELGSYQGHQDPSLASDGALRAQEAVGAQGSDARGCTGL